MTNSAKNQTTPVIIVHGGAWAIPKNHTEATLDGVQRAVRAGYDALKRHKTAIDAVEAAIMVMEDDSVFDAGCGSVLNAAGQVEMDAGMMTDNGKPQAGAVAAIRGVRHPVSVARGVLHSEHILLVGNGACKFAEETGAEAATDEDLVCDAARAEWRRFRQYGRVVDRLFNGCDTVGAVALDEHGVLACGTSTGGITYKRVGRVGDSPLVGAGYYCEGGVAAASTTGHGESIMLVGLARNAVDGVKHCGVAESARNSIRAMKQRTGGCGGVIVVDGTGEIGWDFSTERMAWASIARDGKLRSGIDGEGAACRAQNA